MKVSVGNIVFIKIIPKPKSRGSRHRCVSCPYPPLIFFSAFSFGPKCSFFSRSLINLKNKSISRKKRKKKIYIYTRSKQWYKLLFRHLGLKIQYFSSSCCCHCCFHGNQHVEVSRGQFGGCWMCQGGKNGGENGGHDGSQ